MMRHTCDNGLYYRLWPTAVYRAYKVKSLYVSRPHWRGWGGGVATPPPRLETNFFYFFLFNFNPTVHPTPFTTPPPLCPPPPSAPPPCVPPPSAPPPWLGAELDPPLAQPQPEPGLGLLLLLVLVLPTVLVLITS